MLAAMGLSAVTSSESVICDRLTPIRAVFSRVGLKICCKLRIVLM